MASKAEDLITRSRALRKENRFEEALIASLAATNEDPTDPDGWWQTSLNRISLNDNKNSVVSLRKTIELAPYFSNGYAQLAEILQEQKTREPLNKHLSS
jgi:hypothetical protein